MTIRLDVHLNTGATISVQVSALDGLEDAWAAAVASGRALVVAGACPITNQSVRHFFKPDAIVSVSAEDEPK